VSSQPQVILPEPHPEQARFIDSPAKRKVIRAGRRGGKTVGMAIMAVEKFLAGRRVLYAAPTSEQVGRFWTEVTRALAEPVDVGIFRQNVTEHIIELPGTEQRIRAKTAWNADSLRGDYADILILDEWQLMNEDAWGTVGAPMLLDRDGDAVFVYTPPSLRSRSVSKANDPQHAAKMWKQAQADTTGRWGTFHFGSSQNPHISQEALAEISKDMTAVAYRQEIMAEDVDEAPGALWTRDIIEKSRVMAIPELQRVVIGVDPSASSTGDEAGIVTVGRAGRDIYAMADDTVQGSPKVWATAAVVAFHRAKANCIIAEKNQGGEMVELTIHTVDPNVPVRLVHASRGKATRAEPVSAVWEHGRGHIVGSMPALEDELCLWMPGDDSPNRLDALVHAATDLIDADQVASDASLQDAAPNARR